MRARRLPAFCLKGGTPECIKGIEDTNGTNGTHGITGPGLAPRRIRLKPDTQQSPEGCSLHWSRFGEASGGLSGSGARLNTLISTAEL